jgi:hypothetical protein
MEVLKPMQQLAPDAALPRRSGPLAFFRERWIGNVAMGRIFWYDIMLVGTAINLLSAMAALLTFTSDLPGWVGLTVFLLPLPYNIFLVACVWRKAGKRTDIGAMACQLFAALWLIATVYI